MIRNKSISFVYKEYDSADELEPADLELLNSACNVAENAYAPYSHFKVGAAVRLKSGKIVTGSNVENAAFPSGICAERNALSNASSNYPGDSPVALAVSAVIENGTAADVVSPCGNCRQVIAEEEYRNRMPIRIILNGKNKIIVVEKGADLLPIQFNRDNLKISSR